MHMTWLLVRDDNNKPPDDNKNHHDGLSGWAIFIIVLVVLLVLGAGGWFAYTYLRKRQGGGFSRGGGGGGGASNSISNYLAPRPGGLMGWVNDKFSQLKNRRYAAGNYEDTTGLTGPAGGGGGRGRRGAPFDPDEAWDSRVGNEADMYGPGGYYEEQELGLQAPTAYTGTGYAGQSGGLGVSGAAGEGANRSASRQRELDDRYAEETGRVRANPFGDENAAPRGRSKSPMSINTGGHSRLGDGMHSSENSPTERKSVFRENV